MTVARFASSKKDSGVYAVTELDTGELACDCRGFTFRQSCAHVAAVQRWREWNMQIPDKVLPPPARWQREEVVE